MRLTSKHLLWALPACVVLGLSACGGGGGGSSASNSASSGASSGATSSGAITAFGSVFVNGHEFVTSHATVVDDDTGTTSASSALEVGEVVDVKPASNSTEQNPVASELHIHPLARGYVDNADRSAGTITVMGQTVQLTSATTFSDHRACATQSSSCTAITGQAGLSATSVNGSTVTKGNYVTVHGYLFSGSSSGGAANIVATLISISDDPGNAGGNAAFKAEGVISVGTTSSIGGLTLDLSSATCRVNGQTSSCASAYSSGQVVSVFSNIAPSLPASTFSASGARLAARVTVDTSGSTAELEGGVSSVSSANKTFVLRGLTVDASSLPSTTSLPAVGDIVRVTGTVSSDGLSVVASKLTVLHAAASSTVALQGDLSNITAGSDANTYTVSVLGQTITVNASTHLADRSTFGWWNHGPDSTSMRFNIGDFQTYLAQTGMSQHVVINAQSDGSGKLTALSLTIVPASTVSGVAGIVDSSPAPAVSGTTATFSVHGIAVTSDTAAIKNRHGNSATAAAGEIVEALGTASGSNLTVGSTFDRTHGVLDLGTPQAHHDRGGF